MSTPSEGSVSPPFGSPVEETSLAKKPSVKKQPPNTEEITITAEDTLERLAILSDISVAALMRLNGMFSRMLLPGQKLWVPAGYTQRKQAASASAMAVARQQEERIRSTSFESPPYPLPDFEEVLKVNARMLVDEYVETGGLITVTPSHFYFEPALHDMTAHELGLDRTSFNVELRYITSCDTQSRRVETVHVTAPSSDEEEFASVQERRVTQLSIYVSTPSRGDLSRNFLIEQEADALKLRARIRDWSRQRRLDQEMAQVPLEQQLPVLHRAETTFVPKSCMAKVRHILPPLLRLAEWTLAYSTQRDGISLNSFYRLTDGLAPTLLFVSDEHEHVFGALAPDPWRRRADKYYGTGNSFLFTFTPTFKVYEWTGANDCIQLSDEKFIGLGGGGAFGLWLDADFVHGTSRRSPTYDNDPLPGTEEFRILHVEVYTFSS